MPEVTPLLIHIAPHPLPHNPTTSLLLSGSLLDVDWNTTDKETEAAVPQRCPAPGGMEFHVEFHVEAERTGP